MRLGVVSREGDEAPRWLDLAGEGSKQLPAAGWEYLARVVWMPDGSLAVQVENRQQTRLQLLRFDPQSAQRTTLLSESNQIWINLHDLFKPLERGGFLWASERTGFRHLYLYEDTGRMLRQLTDGDWMVDSVAGVDETQGMVYFTATRESPLESHLYVVSLTGGDPRRITQQPVMHAVTLDSACRCFVDVADAIDRPPMVSVRSLPDGGLVRVLFEPGDARLTELDLRPPELVSFATRDGVELHGAIFQPSVTDFGPGPYPTIVSVYGGPHVQRVVNGWRPTVAMRAQYLRSQGFLVFMLDNRGSARRGLVFEGAIRHKLGRVEVEDQVDGVRWLVERGLADPQRVGVYGWSYGGYIACLCLAKAPETFRVAVAGAPVASWDGYDTHYTERYMDTPQVNGSGYETSSVMPHVPGMEGELLLVHGLIDENVHFRHTARLINALVRARKPYQLLLFPDERHTPRRLEDRVFLEEQVVGFFQRYL